MSDLSAAKEHMEVIGADDGSLSANGDAAVLLYEEQDGKALSDLR